MDALATKAFPDNYSQEVLKIFEALSMTDLKKFYLVGSASLRSQQYSADFDCMEKVRISNAAEMVHNLRDVVKSLRSIPDCFIGDIKCGEEKAWDVFNQNAGIVDGKVQNFNPTESKGRIANLRNRNIISPTEAKDADSLLDKATTNLGFIMAKKTIKFHILRWNPQQILAGFQEYRGYRFNLEDAVTSGGLIKVDAVANIADRYTEFSAIYDTYLNGNLVSERASNIVQSLKNDIMFYNQTNPFKALKRFFALIKLRKDTEAAAVLVPIMNSDLGRLYQIIGDLQTLRNLLDRPSSAYNLKQILGQIDDMKARLGNLYQLRDFLSKEHSIIGSLNALLNSPATSIKGKLDKLISELEGIINVGTVKIINTTLKNLFPGGK
jgi:hypothetical protein